MLKEVRFIFISSALLFAAMIMMIMWESNNSDFFFYSFLALIVAMFCVLVPGMKKFKENHKNDEDE